MHIPTDLNKKLLRPLTAGLALCVAQSARAVDMGGVAIHGSVSATAAYSPDYNYLGDTHNRLDLNQTELTVNGTKRFDNGLKAAAQLYAYEFDGFNDLTVDFANLDYSFRQEIGVRVGRNKLPGGFYNEVQDLDQVRVFASLPLNFYPRAARSFGANYDGASVYGNIPGGKAGSFDYQAYVGVMQPLDKDMPFMKGLGASKLDIQQVYGVSLVWNTPVDGLRIGYTFQKSPEIDSQTGPAITEVDYQPQVFSVEYTRGKWIATVEYKHADVGVDVTNFPVPNSSSTENHTYAQLTYQATDRVGLGVYYCYSDYSSTGVDKDAAFAASYAIQPWWLVKAEVHFMDGINQLGSAGDSNPGASDNTWNYLVLKTTVSF
ncbi:MAG TPA: hypothetical protein VIO38_01605 [Rariglobus sp.]